MFPFLIEPGWYERYWLKEAPLPTRRAALKRLLAASHRLAAMMLSAAWTIATVGALQ